MAFEVASAERSEAGSVFRGDGPTPKDGLHENLGTISVCSHRRAVPETVRTLSGYIAYNGAGCS
jgi:hypothetical protein